MLSKEEIEEAKECLQETIQNTYAEGKAIKLNNLFEYTEQLETKLETVTTQRNKLATELSDKEDDKQKLIEKLEEFLRTIKHDGIYGYDEDILEILKIVKGEKE